MKYNGNSWVVVGSAGFSAGSASEPSIAFDSNDVLHIAYVDGDDFGKAIVMKFNGSSWVNVGSSGFSVSRIDNPKLKFDSNNIAFLLYEDFSDEM